MNDALLTAALHYRAAGLSIIPIGADKKPTIKWKRYQSVIADEGTMRQWFSQPGVMGLAVVCGKISGDLLVLDFDLPRMYESWYAAVGDTSDHLPMQLTGSLEGFQMFLRCDDPGRNLELAFYPNEEMASGRAIGIETRGEGGYACLPPTLHPDGHNYEMLRGDLADIPRVPMSTVRMFLNEARLLDEAPQTRQQLERAKQAAIKPRPSNNGQGSVIEAWNCQMPIRTALANAGYTVFRDRFTRPGPDASPGSVVVMDDARSYHWSTNDPLHDGHAHDSFSVFCELEHGGDVRAAVKAAARQLGMSNSSSKKRKTVVRSDAYRSFPVDELPQPVRRFVKVCTEAIGCDAAFVALPVLGVLAGAIGNTYRVALKRGWTEPSVLWFATVGESGSLKSPGFRHALAPIRKAQHRAIGESEEAMAEFEIEKQRHDLEQKKWKKEGGIGDPPLAPEPPKAKRFIVSDVTVEALAPILRSNPRGVLLARDELAAWVGSFDRYAAGGKGADAPVWLSMYDGDSILVDRKGGEKTIHVPSAAVSVVGTIQPGKLARAFTAEHRESGLLARVMLAQPPSHPALWRDDDIPEQIEKQYASLVEALLQLSPGFDQDGEPRARQIAMTGEAKNAYVEWHDEHAYELAALNGDLAAAFSKIKGQCARLALIIHTVRVVADDPTVNRIMIDYESMTAAITLANWFKREATRVYAILSESDDEREMRQLVDWIQRQGGTVTVRDVTRGLRRYRGASDAAEADLEQLVEAGRGRWADPAPGASGGRPSRQFILISETDGDETPVGDSANGVLSPSPSNEERE